MNQERDLPLEVFKPHVQMYAIVEPGSGDYELLGHGFLSIVTDEVDNETVDYLQVESVKDSQLILRSRLRLSHNYEKQRGSVIVWNDCTQKSYYDLALSFEGQKQCDIFWRLICEKIGKNYLEINGREALDLPSETNLPYILDKTKTAKDMVQYNLLNSPAFAASLGTVFKKFQSKNDKMGMGMIGRIVKSIFSNVDYRMVQALFKDPTFDLLLQVQKFLHDVDFPQWWAQTVKIRNIVPLSEDLILKVNLIHRLNFYRENILDFLKEGYLEHILVMTQIEFSKEIISHLTKENTFEELIKLTYQPSQEPNALHKDIAEEETFLAENEEIKKQQFAEKKLEFLLEAIIISKQMQCEKAQERFFDKVFRSGVMEMSTQYLDRGILKALDFFNCLAQLSPSKFIDYLKIKYREKPSDNLHMKLSKKYCLGSDQMQASILELIKNLAQGFKNKENIDFFMGTFFATVFGCCKEMKAVLSVISDVQNVLQNVQTFFSQAVKSRVFDKLVVFMRNQKQEKTYELRASKVLKRVLLQNADSSWSFKRGFLNLLNQQIIKSGFFDYCMTILEKHIKFNNVISSSMLQNIKIIRDMKRFTIFHKEIQKNYQNRQIIAKYLTTILEAKEEKENMDGTLPFDNEREQELQQEREEAYLMEQVQGENINQTIPIEQNKEELQNLRKLKREISQEQRLRQIQIQQLSLPSKKIKPNEQMPIFIELELPFDQGLEGDK